MLFNIKLLGNLYNVDSTIAPAVGGARVSNLIILQIELTQR